MFTVEEWKVRIVKIFVFRSQSNTIYNVVNADKLYQQFADNFEKNTQTAYEQLLSSKIIERIQIDKKTFYALNFTEKSSEISQMIKSEPFMEKSGLIQPTDKEFRGLKEEFRYVSSRRWPNRGFYYFCTKTTDPNSWIVLIKTKPAVVPYRIILGSTTDKKSRIMRIWKAVLKVSKIHGDAPFIRKHVENIEPKACGNNRLPSKSAFHIFVELKWLRVVNRKGNTVYYQVTKKE